MSELSRIIRLTPSEALAVRERAAGGDLAAIRAFFLHASWLKIKAKRRYSREAKREALAYVIKNYSFGMAGPQDVDSASVGSLAPVSRPSEIPMPWFGQGPPPPDAPNSYHEGA
jgi:hypothetical protein